MEKLIRTISNSWQKAFGWLTPGITLKQWLASVIICAMLSSVFALPVRAAIEINARRAADSRASNPNNFEPVNASLPIWKEVWMNLNEEAEAWLSPVRAINTAYNDADDKDKSKRKIENPSKPKSEAKSEVEKETKDKDFTEKDDSAALNADKTIAVDKETGRTEKDKTASKTEEAVKKSNSLDTKTKILASTARTAAALIVNQLPDEEKASLYSAQNNLGSPAGQTEMDSPNRAAATKIKHRAGVSNFSFDVPLASLSGRGINAGVGTTYNSRTWNKSCIAYDTSGVCTQNHFTYDVEQSWIAPGFSSGFGYLDSESQTGTVTMMNGSNTYNTTKNEIVPLGIVDSDGTRHQIQCKTFSQIPGGHSSALYCSAYETADGSFIRITRNGTTYSIGGTVSYSNTSFTVVYPNGSKIYYGTGFGISGNRKHYPYIVQDSNGNRIRIAYNFDQSGRIDAITDTLNRQIKFYYENDGSGKPDKLVAVTVPDMNTGELQTARFYYEDMNLNYAGKFVAGSQITAPASIRVLKYVYFPSTKSGFKYEYDPSFGMIRKISRMVGMTVSDAASLTATGTVTSEGAWAATTEYNYQTGTPALNDVPKYTQRTDDWQGRTSPAPAITLYDVPDPVAGQYTVSTITVKDADFDIDNKTSSYNTGDWASGLVGETSIEKIYGPSRQYRTLMAKTKYFWAQGSAAFGGRQNPKLQKVEITNDAGLTKATEFEYDQYNNQTAVKEYDFAAPGSLGTLLRRTNTTYETGSGWINNNLLGLTKSVETIVGGASASKTVYEYDHNGSDATITQRADIDTTTHDTFYNPGHPAYTETICPNGSGNPPPGNAPQTDGSGCVNIYHPGYGAASAYRGNVTKVTAFADATLATDPNVDISDREYDIAGNLVSATLSCCQLKTIAYDKANEYAFPISETKGSSPTQLTSSVTYNRSTGLVINSTDKNNQVTNYEYEPDTLRQKKVTYPNGGYALTEYSDKLAASASEMVIGFARQTTTLEANKTVQSYSYFDGRGARIRSASQTAPAEWSVSAIEYDALGRAKRSYNPFYAATPTGAIPVGTAYTEVLSIDALGRTTQVRLQDNTTAQTAFSDVNTTPAGFNKTFVTGNDQAGKQRRQIADALGRVTRVDEPDASGSLGDVTAPTQPTVYEYDGNDNLSKVTQTGGATQERLFKYDSLSRLTQEKQVEATATLNDAGAVVGAGSGQWTKVLKYNANGLLVDGYDARGVNTHFVYDGINRVSTVTFSDGTPQVTYTYDEARTGYYNKGALTRVETAQGDYRRPDTPYTASEFDYDLMGRVKSQRQIIGTQAYYLGYNYNLAGQLTSESYPSGKVVSMGYDTGGRLSSVNDAARTYLNNLQYQGKGNALSSITLGNGTSQSFALNDRLQMTNQTLAKGSEILQKYDYGYGQINLDTGAAAVNSNNGQLAKVESTIGTAKQWEQRFGYDAVGRLSESREYRGDNINTLVYKQKFDFDRYGNLYRKNASNPAAGQQNPLPYNPIEDADISQSTNRFTTTTTYDNAGNVTQDTKFRNINLSYDANGRVFKTSNTDNTNPANSVYNASGNRVATQVDGVWSFFIYDIGGKMVAEYGGLSATDEGGVKYVLQDWQGSSRAILSNSGFVQARMDYTSFGEEINSGVGQRTIAQGFSATNNLSQKYALTERDKATGLDHTWFRKNENRAGRWTSPDPYNGSMSLGNPQSFNRYSYVENQPTNFIDPTGLLVEGEACQINDQVDSNGSSVYQGTVRNGRCQSHAGSAVQIFGWGLPWGGLGNGGGGIFTSRGTYNGGGIQPVPMTTRDPLPTSTPPLNPPQNSPCGQLGVNFSGFAGAGLGNGAAGTAGVTVAENLSGPNQFLFAAPSAGGFFGGSGNGGGVGYPSREGIAIGVAASLGPSLFVSNALTDQEQTGVFLTEVLATPFITITRDRNPSGNPPTTNLTFGMPSGLGYFRFKTNTAKPYASMLNIPGCSR